MALHTLAARTGLVTLPRDPFPPFVPVPVFPPAFAAPIGTPSPDLPGRCCCAPLVAVNPNRDNDASLTDNNTDEKCECTSICLANMLALSHLCRAHTASTFVALLSAAFGFFLCFLTVEEAVRGGGGGRGEGGNGVSKISSRTG